jgi:hypothetical protein
VRTPGIAIPGGFIVLTDDGNLRILNNQGMIRQERRIQELAGDGAWIEAISGSDLVACGRGNILWVLDRNLSLVPGFPLPGSKAWMYNLDGRGGAEILSLGYDGKIYAYELPEKL